MESQQSGLAADGHAGRGVRRSTSQKAELGPAPPPRAASSFKDRLTAGRSTAELNSTFGRYIAIKRPIFCHMTRSPDVSQGENCKQAVAQVSHGSKWIVRTTGQELPLVF